MNVRRQTPQTASNRKGASLIEFALVAPVFFLFIFAAMEFAHLNTLRNSANNAAYEAARCVVVPGAAISEAEAAAQQILAAVGVTTYTINVTPDPITDETREVTVAIDIPYAQNAIVVPWFTGSANVHSESTLHTERYGGIQVPSTP